MAEGWPGQLLIRYSPMENPASAPGFFVICGGYGRDAARLARMLLYQLLIERIDAAGDRAHAARRADRFAIDRGNRGLGAESAGQKRFIGAVGLNQRKVPLKDRDIIQAAEIDHLLARHAVHAIIAGRGPDLALADDKE